MGRISLKQFINETKGKRIDVPWGNGRLKGQCVSLVQQYIGQCLGQPMKPRGNAKDWKKTYVNEGLGKIVKKPQYGDIIVYNIGKFGHIAIYIDNKTMYDQNNGYHDNYKAGYGKLLSGGTYLRPNVKLVPDTKPTPQGYTTGDYRLLNAKALRKNHSLGNNVYKVKDCPSWLVPHLTSIKPKDDAKIKAGSEIAITEIYDEKGRIWGKFMNAWVVLQNIDGTPQAVKTK